MFVWIASLAFMPTAVFSVNDEFPGTKPLTWEGPIWKRMISGVDQFLLEQIELSIEGRTRFWNRDFTSQSRYETSTEPNRQRLKEIIGVTDSRTRFEDLELIATVSRSARVASSPTIEVYAVRWPVFGNVEGEGLLLVPARNRLPVANVIAIPDADQTPESICGLVDDIDPASQFARRLAEEGCRVLVPTLIDRELKKRAGRSNLTSREFLHRSAFELGRHIAGYEVQKVRAGVDWLTGETGDGETGIGVIGWGEGGMIALYAAAIDKRIDCVCVSGYFDSRQTIWEQPIDRNVFGLLEQFGDAEVASLIAPRKLIIEAAKGPELTLPSDGGAPATLESPVLQTVRTEVERTRQLTGKLHDFISLIETAKVTGSYGSPAALASFLKSLDVEPGKDLESGEDDDLQTLRQGLIWSIDPAVRQRRQQQQIDDHNQWLLSESASIRRDFINIGPVGGDHASNRVDTSSTDHYETSIRSFRKKFRDDVIGHFDLPLLAMNPRTRVAYERPTWTGYEVVLDVFPNVIAYGVLCVPRDLKEGERRPVVVCQHGLEGTPQDTIEGDHWAYHDFAAKLAERGFITFAPQNLYIGNDRFRTLQRKAYPLKKTLFSVMTAQHQQIVNWLNTLPMVDSDRIAFYGLSYGGKSAMRIPAIVTDYCLSICSADFNEWVWKNASTRSPYSYVWTNEYEIFEFNLGSTFNYAEMAALIAPRPFMVERGHHDGVAPDETVGYEFAKVRHLYASRLKIPDRCAIEWFEGPHTINGQGTFDFLHHHLDWPIRK